MRRYRVREVEGNSERQRKAPRFLQGRRQGDRVDPREAGLTMSLEIAFLVVLALAFDYINGFHDSANSIATIVSTRVLTPGQAVLWAAFFNFIAAFFGELKVANTMGRGVIQFDQVKALGPEAVLAMVFSALVGAIAW